MKQRSFIAKGVRSLAWRDDGLVDWVGGGRSFALDGTETAAHVSYAYRFDAAIASPDGRFAVIYEKLGTKALLLDHGKIVRELDRSFYCAEAYEYPIAFLSEPHGRLLLAHCPKSYRQIEFEDVEGGELATTAHARAPADFFHSRLAVSPNVKRLVSAGWIWHPWSAVVTFELAQAFADGRHLDRGSALIPASGFEEASACWLSDDLLVVGGSGEEENLDAEVERQDPALKPRGIAVYDVAKGACLRAFVLEEPPGTMFAIDATRVLSLYRHPKVIDLTTGQVLHTWNDLSSGRQDSSILWHLKGDAVPPIVAFDPVGKRFAISNGDNITVLDFS